MTKHHMPTDQEIIDLVRQFQARNMTEADAVKLTSEKTGDTEEYIWSVIIYNESGFS